ncbi:hypothetical protein AAC387_Pa11g1018 [Persea americana]
MVSAPRASFETWRSCDGTMVCAQRGEEDIPRSCDDDCLFIFQGMNAFFFGENRTERKEESSLFAVSSLDSIRCHGKEGKEKKVGGRESKKRSFCSFAFNAGRWI